MFDQILQLVKEHIGANPQVSSAISADKADAVHYEIAAHINNGLQNQAATNGGVGGLLSSLTSGTSVTNAIEHGLVSSLASKFGLSSFAIWAIAGALPGILQKFAHKDNNPNNMNIAQQSIGRSFPQNGLAGLF